MYPDFRYLLHGIFGIEMPEWVGIFKTFGFFVALAFLGAAYTLIQELKRREKAGYLAPSLSVDKKTGKSVMEWPHARVSEIVMLAALGGIAGAKIFNAFETWNEFIKDPIGSLFSRYGLTFYGGLIVATAVIWYYARKHKINFLQLCDATAPGLMLAYGVGRLGCHFSGDGDWGIHNSAYITGADGKLHAAAATDFMPAVQSAPEYFTHQFGGLTNVPHLFAKAPGWLPDWLYAMNYPSNVNNEGIPLPGCTGDYCAVLPMGVFPTPLYEAVTCILLFGLLWMLRKRISKPFNLFGIYLVFNGLERFFVEKIRVNYKYDWGFVHPTQAEIISTCLVLAGVLILLTFRKPAKIVVAGPEVRDEPATTAATPR